MRMSDVGIENQGVYSAIRNPQFPSLESICENLWSGTYQCHLRLYWSIAALLNYPVIDLLQYTYSPDICPDMIQSFRKRLQIFEVPTDTFQSPFLRAFPGIVKRAPRWYSPRISSGDGPTCPAQVTLRRSDGKGELASGSPDAPWPCSQPKPLGSMVSDPIDI